MRTPARLAICLVLAACQSEQKIGVDPSEGMPAASTDAGDGSLGDVTDVDTTADTPTNPTTPTTGDTAAPPTGTTAETTGTSPPIDTGLTGPEICETAANLVGYLDGYQTAGDGKVLFCHSQNGNKWVYIESDISACLPHLGHAYDIFPTTGCDS